VRRQQQTRLGSRDPLDQSDALQRLIESLEALHAKLDDNVPAAVGCVPGDNNALQTGLSVIVSRAECDYNSHIHPEEDSPRGRKKMRKIQLKDAKANLSSVVNEAVNGKPAIITRHGKPEAVLLGFEEWERLAKVPTFGQLLMSAPLQTGDVPRRNPSPARRVKF
jgi:antitoxin Phd